MKICISGFAGCGKTTVANQLSALNGFEVINVTFKDLAKERGVTLEKFQKIAEKDKSIDKKLDDLLVKKANKAKNAIISTWLCAWIIKDADIRVFLDASLKERAKRIAKRESLPFKIALTRTKTRDLQNIKRYKKIYGIDISDKSVYDLIINTEQVNPTEAAYLINALAIVRKKFEIDPRG